MPRRELGTRLRACGPLVRTRHELGRERARHDLGEAIMHRVRRPAARVAILFADSCAQELAQRAAGACGAHAGGARELAQGRGHRPDRARERHRARARGQMPDARLEERIRLERRHVENALEACVPPDHEPALGREAQGLLHPERRTWRLTERVGERASFEEIGVAERRADELAASRLVQQPGAQHHRTDARERAHRQARAPAHEEGAACARSRRGFHESGELRGRRCARAVQIVDRDHALEARRDRARQGRDSEASRSLEIARHRDALAPPPKGRHDAHELDAVLRIEDVERLGRQHPRREIVQQRIGQIARAHLHAHPARAAHLQALTQLAQEARLAGAGLAHERDRVGRALGAARVLRRREHASRVHERRGEHVARERLGRLARRAAIGRSSERIDHFARGREPIDRLLLEQAHHDRGERRGHGCRQRRRRGREMIPVHVVDRSPARRERDLARGELVEQHTERVEVATRIERLAADRLGRDVDRRADHGAVRAAAEGVGDPEVEQHETLAARIDEHVRRLHVAMQDAARVQVCERATELHDEIDRTWLDERETCVIEVDARHERLGEERRIAQQAEVEHVGEARMAERREHGELAAQRSGRPRIALRLAVELQRHVPMRTLVEHLVDLAAAARSDEATHDVAVGDARAQRQRARARR